MNTQRTAFVLQDRPDLSWEVPWLPGVEVVMNDFDQFRQKGLLATVHSI
jgi:hypothetical protein